MRWLDQDGQLLARDARREGRLHQLMIRLSKHESGRLLDGMQHDAFPARAQTTPAIETAHD